MFYKDYKNRVYHLCFRMWGDIFNFLALLSFILFLVGKKDPTGPTSLAG